MRRSEYASAILVAVVAMAVTAMVMSLLLGLIGRQQAKVEDVSGVMVTGQQGVTVTPRQPTKPGPKEPAANGCACGYCY